MGVCVCLRPFGVAQDKGLRFILRLRYASLSKVGFGVPFPCSSVYSVVKNGVGDQGKFAINLGGGYCLTCGLLVVDNVEQMGARVVTFCPVCVASSCTLKTE